MGEWGREKGGRTERVEIERGETYLLGGSVDADADKFTGSENYR